MRHSVWSLVLITLFLEQSFGSMAWGPVSTTVWQNPQCTAQQRCELQEFNLRQQDWVADYSSRYPEEAAKLGEPLLNYGTTVFYEYKTDRPEVLENYTIVSFIKGCMYRSKLKSDGTLDILHMFARDLLGKLAVYQHQDWQIDSIDEDPMYKNEFPENLVNNPNGTRHGRWEWTADPSSFDQNNSIFYRTQKPTVGRLFTSDRPGTAFRMNVEEAKNVSIQVRACLYPTSQVPSTIALANETDFGAPVMCHEWAHSKIYNHIARKFESLSTVSQVCEGEPQTTANLVKVGGAYYYK